MSSYLFTSESVSEGHPDKIADQISDAVLDEILKQDPKARVACETYVKTGMALVGGEITTSAWVDIENLTRQVICVTHLPQVACHGHHQFNVEKFTVDDKTETKMTALSQEERVPALARLLGGSEITDLALANAQEMLDLVK